MNSLEFTESQDKISIKQVDYSDLLVRKGIQTLNRDIFTDELIDTSGDNKCLWWIVLVGGQVAGYCSIKELEPGVGCLSRAGVLPEFRGRGLQKLMITTRINKARQLGWKFVVTDTHKDNVASYTSLQRMGFEEFTPKNPWVKPAWARVSKFWKIEL